MCFCLFAWTRVSMCFMCVYVVSVHVSVCISSCKFVCVCVAVCMCIKNAFMSVCCLHSGALTVMKKIKCYRNVSGDKLTEAQKLREFKGR